MSVSVVKIAPTALILAAAAYTAWPHVFAPEAPPQPPSSPAEQILDSLITPAVGEPHERNPFLDSEAVRAAAVAQVRTLLDSLAKSLLAARDAKRSTPHGRPGGGGSGRTVTASAATTGRADAATDDPRSQLTLKATYVQGKHRIAMIGNRLYEPGEAIRGLDSLEGRCVLEEIRTHSVVLRYRGKPLVLNYPGLEDRPATPNPARMPAPTGGADDLLGLDPLSLLGGAPLALPGGTPVRGRAGR